MDWITERIAIGNIEDAMRLERLPEAGITAILSLNGWPNHSWNRLDLPWRCVPLIDGEGNAIGQLADAVDSLRALAGDHRVLVHCMEGVSRSALVVACYLSVERGISFSEALATVAASRAGVRVQDGLLALQEAYAASLVTRAGR